MRCLFGAVPEEAKDKQATISSTALFANLLNLMAKTPNSAILSVETALLLEEDHVIYPYLLICPRRLVTTI